MADIANLRTNAETGLSKLFETARASFATEEKIAREEAFKLQKTYLAEHGLTLKGMMLNHGVDPQAFHAIFHDMSLDALAHDQALTAAIARLPGRRLIFTNADDVHAERVLERLGLSHLFDEVFHIGSADYLPKPNLETYRRMADAHAIDPAATAFFEDSEHNLKPAADLGITTVLVGPHASASTAPFVHHRTDKLAPFLTSAQIKEAA